MKELEYRAMKPMFGIEPMAKRIKTDNPFVLGLKFACPKCHADYIEYKQKFCSECGSKFVWDRWRVDSEQ